MNIKLLDNAEEIRKKFIDYFVLSWEEFQIKQKEWIAQMAKTNYSIDLEWYEDAYLWDKTDTAFLRVSIKEALAFLIQCNSDVLFMSESISHHASRHLFLQGEKHIGFVAQAASKELAALIEEEWFDSYRLGMQNMYNPDPVLPEDLYVFDFSMKWCVVFTHETTDWESEITDDFMKAAESRYCMICRRA